MITVAAAVDEFLLEQSARGNSPATVRWYGIALRDMARHLCDDPREVQTHDIRAYIVQLRQSMSEYSVFSYSTAVFAFWKWAAGEYKFDNPCGNIKHPRRPKLQTLKATTADDIIKLMSATRDDVYGVRNRAIIAFLMDTGARLGGAANLLVENLFIANGTAIVIEKGKNVRQVYFTAVTARILHAWLWERENLQKELAPNVFVNIRTGHPLTPSGIEQMFKRLKRDAKIKGRVNPHSFRHNFAREYVMNGGDIATLSKLMGHRNIQTTADLYALFTPDELQQFHSKYTPANTLFK